MEYALVRATEELAEEFADLEIAVVVAAISAHAASTDDMQHIVSVTRADLLDERNRGDREMIDDRVERAER